MIGALQGQNGIGTLREKTIHSVLKYYYAPDSVYHEIKIGSYVADICVDGEIFEVQTRNFNKMRDKLDFFSRNMMSPSSIQSLIPSGCCGWTQRQGTDPQAKIA